MKKRLGVQAQALNDTDSAQHLLGLVGFDLIEIGIAQQRRQWRHLWLCERVLLRPEDTQSKKISMLIRKKKTPSAFSSGSLYLYVHIWNVLA